MPNPSLFPIAELSFKLKDGTQIKMSDSTLATALQYSSSVCCCYTHTIVDHIN
jgi:hypothetical protein